MFLLGKYFPFKIREKLPNPYLLGQVFKNLFLG